MGTASRVASSNDAWPVLKTLVVFYLLVFLFVCFVCYINAWRTFGSLGLAGRVGVCGLAWLVVGLFFLFCCGWGLWGVGVGRAGGRVAWRGVWVLARGLVGLGCLPSLLVAGYLTTFCLTLHTEEKT